MESETVDAADDRLDLTTTYARDNRGQLTSTTIAGYGNRSDEMLGALSDDDSAMKIGTFTASSVSQFDDRFDLPRVAMNADPYEYTSTIYYHELLGLPTSVTDVNVARTTNEYDALGRVVKSTDELRQLSTDTQYAWTTGGASDWTATQTVTPPSGHNGAASGAPITGVVGVPVSSVYAVRTVTTAQPAVTAYFDRLGRQIRTIREGFNGQKTVTDTAYNSLGQVIAVSLPYPQGTAPLWTKTAYDALGRVETVLAPNGPRGGGKTSGLDS